MKHILVHLSRLIILPVIFITSLSGMGQIPEGYYSSAHNLAGEHLKTALHEIIKGHTDYPYTAAGTDVWDILKETDRDTANHGNVILFYSGRSVEAAQEYNNGNGWTREQVWARSHGDFNTGKGAGTDLHHIRPVDPSVNSARNNKDFDWGGNQYIDGDGPTQCYSDADSWEPRDAVKGDVARMLFYMAVRYEGENGEPDLELVDVTKSDELTEPGKGFHGKLSALLDWHKSDPVDSFEIRRNEIIFSYQNNRNPFIDHPEFVEQIWTINAAEPVKETPFHVFPNPARDVISIRWYSAQPAHGMLVSAGGTVIREFIITETCRLAVPELKSGMYLLKITNQNATYDVKVMLFK